jgi:D-alanine-D-alanine ligase
MRVLALMHRDLVPPDDISGMSDKEIRDWKSEYDVLTALEHLGHEVRPLGVESDLGPLREMILEWRPHIVFNLLEEFSGIGTYAAYVLGYLELMRQPYTGCNARGLLLADDKPMMKKILKHHRIRMPEFAVFPMGRSVRRPGRLNFPLIVKSATEHGSVGISQASIVHDDTKLAERVAFIHENIETAAIAEEFIDGRELYVGVLGNQRLRTLPIWEMQFKKLAEGAPMIATAKVKWDVAYQKEVGFATGAADLPPETADKIFSMCKRAYRILGLSGYARMDLRLTDEGQVFLLEPNPNPDLSLDEDFANSADSIGIKYEKLVQQLMNLGLRFHAGWKQIESD